MDLLLWYNGVAADLRVSGRDLLADDSLYTAVVISLFTDARARAEDELPPELDGEDRRGYWGDGLEGESVGSRLWLLAREKDTARVRARAEQYAREALAWLVSEGLARAVDVTAAHPQGGVCQLAVRVTYPDDRAEDPHTDAWNFKLDFEGGDYAVEPADA